MAGYADTSFLAAADAFSNWCAHQGVGLFLDSKGFDESLDSLDALAFCHGAEWVEGILV